jgi:hypothetical protein
LGLEKDGMGMEIKEKRRKGKELERRTGIGIGKKVGTIGNEEKKGKIIERKTGM